MLVSELKQILKNIPNDSDIVMQIGDKQLILVAQALKTRFTITNEGYNRIILINDGPIEDKR